MIQETKVVKITPKMAEQLLARNHVNRPLNESNVNSFCEILKRGEFMLSHQGIAIDTNDWLRDGQHRLTAIIRTGIAAVMQVTTGVSPESYQVMDVGGRRRTVAEIYDISNKHAAVARLMAVIEDKTKHSGITAQYLVPYIKASAPYFEDLHGYCSSNTKVWSSAGVQTAAIIRMMDGEDKDYVKLVYYALVHMDFDSMPKVAQTLFRQVQTGKSKGHGTDFFARCLKVFTYKNQHMSAIQVSSTETAIKYAREVIAEHVHGEKIGRHKTPAKPVKASTNYRTAMA